MGLDIYFHKNREENFVGTFRKVNFLIDWISENVRYFDNCDRVLLDKRHIDELLNDINMVLQDKPKAPDILPCTVGCFFGSQEYDEEYWADLEAVKQFCEKLLLSFDFEKDCLFFEAWW